VGEAARQRLASLGREQRLDEIAVTDRTTLTGQTQFPITLWTVRRKSIKVDAIHGKAGASLACAIILLRSLAIH
jgi:hypothetical protein